MATSPLQSVQHPFLFDHIPKSGGTFFRETLVRVFGADQVSPIFDCGPGFPAQQPKRVAEFDRFPVVVGHLRLETRTAFLKRRPRFTLCLAREPGAMIASTYSYWRHNVPPGNPLCDLAKEKSFQEFIRDPLVSMCCDNPITRHLFSIWDPKPLNPGGTAMRLVCGMADSFAFFGVTEHMEESVRLFLRRFVPDFDPNGLDFSTIDRNQSHEPLTIERADKVFLQRLNQCDYRLYGHVRARLLESLRCAEAGGCVPPA